jgi:hypothetical protein
MLRRRRGHAIRCLFSTRPHFRSLFAVLLEKESSLLKGKIEEHRDNEVSPTYSSRHCITHIIMQNPTDQAEAEASIPTEATVTSNGPNWNRAVAVRRKAAKRTHPFGLTEGDLHLVSKTPQAEDIPTARKKPRLEEPLPTTTDETSGKTASPDVAVGIPPSPASDDDTNTKEDLVTDTQPNTGATTVTHRRWTSEEDATLTSAVTNTSKIKWGKEYKINWDAVAMLVPGRTKIQCWNRWKDFLDPNIGRASGRTAGKWTADEDKKLKDAVLTRSGENWETIAALVPGRTKIQCSGRWYTILDTNIDPTTARVGRWTADEDKKLKNAAQTHGGKDWAAVAALVPGRTKKQCRQRWHDSMAVNIYPATARAGKWSAVEDGKLKDAVQTHGGKDWAAITALVPGRTKRQCQHRWHDGLAGNIDPTTARAGKWAEDEDKKLKDSVETHGGKDWAAIAALIPGRTKKQCRSRWNSVLKPNVD